MSSQLKTTNNPEHMAQPDTDNESLEIVSSIKNAFSEKMFSIMSNMLDESDDSLFEMAGNAKTPEERRSYLGVMHEIAVKRSDIESRFDAEVNNLLNIAGKTAGGEVVDFGYANVNSYISSIVSKSYRKHSKMLSSIEARMASITGVPEAKGNDYWMSPKSIARAFLLSISGTEIDNSAIMSFIKLFDINFMERIGLIYSSIDSILVANCIIPPRDWSKNKGNTTSQSASDKNSSLSHLNESTTNRGQSTQENALTAHNNVTVNKIFDMILAEDAIPLPIRNQVSRLKLSILGLAMIDDTFMQRKWHPARILINTIFDSTIGLSADQAEKSSLHSKIESIIDRITEDSTGSEMIYKHELYDLYEFLHKEEERSILMEERSNKTAQGKEKLIIAKTRTDAWIDAWTSSDDTPEFISSMIKNTLKTAFLSEMMRHGEDSRQWSKRVRSINNLIWSAKPKSTEEDVKRASCMIEDIKNDIRDFMETASIAESTIYSFMEKLENEYEKQRICINKEIPHNDSWQSKHELFEKITEDNDRAQKGDAQTAQHSCDVEEIVVTPVSEAYSLESSSTKDKHYYAAESLEIGDWIQYSDDEKRETRAKLSWKSAVTGLYLFVNRSGLKVMDKTVDEIAGMFRSGSAKKIQSASLLDRAINAIRTQ